MEVKFKSVGTLYYAGNDRLTLEIEGDLADYYRLMLPKYIEVQPQMYKAHITVVRTGKEIPKNIEAWGKYEGEKVPFFYGNKVRYDPPYFYLRAWSDRLEDIREELGLSRIRPGYSEFHITIGNTKGKEKPRTFPETRMRWDGGSD